MDPPFLYILPEGSRIFRAKTTAKEGRWHSLTVEDAFTYGTHVTEYSTVKDLKLLNIMSLSFHNDFMDRLMILFPSDDNTGVNINKIKCLLPLGLFDLTNQKLSGQFLSYTLPINETAWTLKHEWSNQLLNGRHRFSEHGLDTYLVEVLEKIYGNYYDGYISPIQWPTKVHGDFFPRELCLFKLGSTKEEKEYLRPDTVTAGGGGAIEKFKFRLPTNLQISEHICQLAKESHFVPFWNPHTEDTAVPVPASTPTVVAATKRRKTTRKQRKHEKQTNYDYMYDIQDSPKHGRAK